MVAFSTELSCVDSMKDCVCVCMKDVRVQWQTVFLITSAFYVFSAMFYLFCGSGKLQSWALADSQPVPVSVRADGLSPTLRSTDRPQSTVIRQFSMPSSVFATSKPGAAESEPYSGDSLRLAAESTRNAPNHLSAAAAGDDGDALDRKLSGKSTSSSKTRDDVTATRRTDHDRDHQPRVRRDQNLSTKQQRHSKPPPLKSPSTTTTTTPALPASPDEELRIYESLSESPV